MTSSASTTRAWRRRRASRAAPLAALVLALGWSLVGLGSAAARGALVRGSLTLAPDPPRPGRPMILTIDLARTNDEPVEGAKLMAELTARAPGVSGNAPSRSFELHEYQEPYGTYRVRLTAPAAGSYTLTVHDRTRPGRDVTAQVPLRVGGHLANGARGFALPGTASSSRPLTRWWPWLVGVALAAGIVASPLARRVTRAAAERRRDRD